MRNKIIIFIIITILVIGGVCAYMFTNKGNDNSKPSQENNILI